MLRAGRCLLRAWFFFMVVSSVVPDQEPLQSASSQHNKNSTNPIAAAWMYMSDDQAYNLIPASWAYINSSVVDILYIGPVGIQLGGNFGLYNSTTTGALANRFFWAIRTARSHNPNIKIIASQWWGIGLGIWGSDLSSLNGSAAFDQYAMSVASFLTSWSSVAGGIDGYDLDYESTNVVEDVPDLLARIRSGMDSLSAELDGRRFYLTASPAELDYLDKAVSYLDYVNIQTYAGGTGLTPEHLIDLGFRSDQLLYGYCPESGCTTPSLNEVKETYKKYKQANTRLAGIHLYRLNSDNYVHENEQQKEIYRFLHPNH